MATAAIIPRKLIRTRGSRMGHSWHVSFLNYSLHFPLDLPATRGSRDGATTGSGHFVNLPLIGRPNRLPPYRASKLIPATNVAIWAVSGNLIFLAHGLTLVLAFPSDRMSVIASCVQTPTPMESTKLIQQQIMSIFSVKDVGVKNVGSAALTFTAVTQKARTAVDKVISCFAIHSLCRLVANK